MVVLQNLLRKIPKFLQIVRYNYKNCTRQPKNKNQSILRYNFVKLFFNINIFILSVLIHIFHLSNIFVYLPQGIYGKSNKAVHMSNYVPAICYATLIWLKNTCSSEIRLKISRYSVLVSGQVWGSGSQRRLSIWAKQCTKHLLPQTICSLTHAVVK